MKIMTMTALALAMTVTGASAQNATVMSQNPNNPTNLGFTVGSGPMRPCTLTPDQQREARRVALEFFRPGIAPADRVALADERYTQHNPAFLKPGIAAGMSDFNYFKSRFGGPPAGQAAGGGRQGGGGAAQGGGRQGGPATPPPAGNPTEMVLQECDMVVVMHKNFVQDPTAAPGTYYAGYTFDMFRVRDGKLVEHWDGARINAPAAPAAGRGGN